MQFDSSESVHTVYVNIVDDRLPELDEFFEIELTNPTGGASIGSRGRTEVVIATNDNAHGVIQIAQVCCSLTVVYKVFSGMCCVRVVYRCQGQLS